MKKVLFCLMILVFSVAFAACEPTTTQASLNTNITQQTTTQTITQTATTTHIPLEHVAIEADIYEVCQEAVITLVLFFSPTNATNQDVVISMPSNSMLAFVPGTNNMQVEVIGNPPGGADVEAVTITVVSVENPSLDNTVQIYVYSDSYAPPQCQMN